LSDLNLQIEDLISQNAQDFEIAKVIKKSIKEYLSSLDDIFNDTQGKDFFVKHTKKIDGFIKVLYKYLLRKHFGNFLPTSNSIPITLIALGSYGREQLCVYSDIDIMVLYQDIKGFNLEPIMEELMILAWDSGLKLGSRVHEINEIEEVVKTDITIKTSIIESRFIYGSKILWFSFQNALTNVQKFGQKEFVLEKLQEHKDRLLKYPLRMEPNIKDGYGGMRESNMLFWMANITYGVNSTRELSGVLFSDLEYKSYRSALEYVFRIRNALHLIAKKKLDSVNFDILPELSRKLGFKDTPKLVKERQCMSKLFDSLHTIHYFSSVMVKKISRQYLFDSANIKRLKSSRVQKNVYIDDDMVYASYNRKAVSLFTLLKELNKFPTTIKKFENSYVYFAKRTILPNNLATKIKQQIKNLLFRENLYPIMKLLYKAGLFQVVIPSSKKILNQPQFDGFHIHPVDIHTLKTLYHCHNIEDPFIAKNYEGLSKEDKSLLNLMALFHDIGKGRTKDHHIVGQELFKKFALSIGLNEEDISIGARIIRYHNMMSMVATNEDIYSQKVILNFTALLGSKRALDILMCHTYGDINSVGKGVYKSSTANLIKELYLQSVRSFENKELLKTSARRVAKENTIKKNKIFQDLPRNTQRKILAIDSNQLFLMFKASDIVELGIKAKEINSFRYEILNDTHLTIKILKLDQLNLGYLLGKLSFLDISSMGIFKLFDNKKYFNITFSEKVDEVDLPFIEEIINNSFDMEKQFKHKKPIIKRKEISIDCNHRDDLAQVKIQAKDQKGLFAYIANVFDDFNVEIESAKIYSSNGRINDLLLIEKNGNFCQNQEELLDLITSE
jgi:[protein-PII] uridylyltransferase